MEFDEKLKIDNSIRQHPQSFHSNTDHPDEVLTNLGFISSFFDA